MDRPSFESLIPQARAQIEKRRGSWRLAAIPWEDVAQVLITHAWLKYHTFIPERGEFSHWLSGLITNRMQNILRDNHQIYSRPCIQGCVFNTGSDTCSKTQSGKQCDECPLYKDWRIRKESHFAIKQTLPLETHEQEVNSIQGDFLDMEAAKKVIDQKIKDKLTKQEWKIYKLLYIQGKTEKEVGKIMGFKKKAGSRLYEGYLSVLLAKKKFVRLAKEIIEQENLA